jgi:PAS domain-containing protein
VSLRSGERKWGEFRHRAPTQSEGDAAALALYLRFVGQAYENYCARQAVLEEKAWAFDALPLGAARLSAQGDLVECNRHFSEILGQDSAQLRGKSLEKVLAERLGLYLGAEWQAFLDAPSRESTSRIVCFTDKRAGARSLAYLSPT